MEISQDVFSKDTVYFPHCTKWKRKQYSWKDHCPGSVSNSVVSVSLACYQVPDMCQIVRTVRVLNTGWLSMAYIGGMSSSSRLYTFVMLVRNLLPFLAYKREGEKERGRTCLNLREASTDGCCQGSLNSSVETLNAVFPHDKFSADPCRWIGHSLRKNGGYALVNNFSEETRELS